MMVARMIVSSNEDDFCRSRCAPIAKVSLVELATSEKVGKPRKRFLRSSALRVPVGLAEQGNSSGNLRCSQQCAASNRQMADPAGDS